jgi:DNA-binding GntR family transcriptional regulator
MEITNNQNLYSVDHKPLSDGLFHTIKHAILNGTFTPGQRLDQRYLAETFKTSRTPIRDALTKLEAEGLVQLIPARGAYVAKIDLDELEQIYQIRIALEESAARLAASQYHDKELDVLEEIEKQFEESVKKEDLEQLLGFDLNFHEITYRPCKNPHLLRLISHYWNSSWAWRSTYCKIPGKLELTIRMHRRILQGLHLRDGELLGLLVREHLQETIRGLRQNRPLDVDDSVIDLKSKWEDVQKK